jgi:hypothetical protein
LTEAVLSYNTLLAEGYRVQELTPLLAGATPEQVTKVYHHMAALAEGGVVMDALLRSIDFVEIRSREEGRAQVTTKESWNYRYLSSGAQRIPGEERLVNYTVNYRLVKGGERWLVNEVSIVASDRQAWDDNLPFFKRPAKTPVANSRGGLDE